MEVPERSAAGAAREAVGLAPQDLNLDWFLTVEESLDAVVLKRVAGHKDKLSVVFSCSRHDARSRSYVYRVLARRAPSEQRCALTRPFTGS